MVVDLDDVLAAQRGRGARFVLETMPRLGAVGVLRLDELHRDASAERGVDAFPDRAHAAAAEQADEPVLAGNQLLRDVRVGFGHGSPDAIKKPVGKRNGILNPSASICLRRGLSARHRGQFPTSPCPTHNATRLLDSFCYTREPMATPLFEPGAPDVLYVIDLSNYVLRAYHAVAPLSNAKGEPTHAAYGTTTMLERLVRERRPALLAVAMDSGRDTFRSELYPEYKATRPPAPDDLRVQLERCEQIVRAFGIPILKQRGVEADDLIACAVRRAREHGIKVVIVGADKDLMQLVGDDVVMWDTMRDACSACPRSRSASA